MATRVYTGAMPCRQKIPIYTCKRKRDARDSNTLPPFVCSDHGDNEPAETSAETPHSTSSFCFSSASSSFSSSFAFSSPSASPAPWAADGSHPDAPPFLATNAQAANAPPGFQAQISDSSSSSSSSDSRRKKSCMDLAYMQ
eukprot:GHVT01076233.1.p1 GENE.GHVT01076233.1~~GHVT01076233.1.p1  ORF type:complete len:152 (-),score=50.76 GHVT01076233.1:131-553(-)